MSKLPDDIQKKVDDYKNATGRPNAVQVDIEFGYSLASARIAELEGEAELQVLLNSLPESIETKALGKCNLLIDKLKGKWMVCYVDAKTETAPFAKSTSVDLKVAAEEIIAKLNEHKDKIIQP